MPRLALIIEIVDCKAVSSRTSASATETATLEWIVTVECDDGSRHEIQVVLGEIADSAAELTASVQRTQGKSAVLDALAADPTRVPARIVCSTEGCQPEYGE